MDLFKRTNRNIADEFDINCPRICILGCRDKMKKMMNRYSRRKLKQELLKKVIITKPTLLVDKDDGDIYGELGEGDRILRSNTIEYLKSTEEWKMEHFYKGCIDEIKQIMKELSTNEKAFLFAVAPYVGYEDCCIKHQNGDDITTEDLVGLTGLGRTTLFSVINSLCEKDILYKGKNSKAKQYFMNPWIFAKGNRINKVLKTMFKNYRIRIMGNKKWKDIK